MHKYYLIFGFVLFWLNSNTFAQESEINAILTHYLKIKEAQSEGKLFMCDFLYQPGTLKFPDVQEYQRQERFYYAFTENSSPLLKMAILQIDSGKVHYDIELVFDEKGELTFCQESQNNPALKYKQIKIYFKEEEMLRFMEGNAIITSSLVFHRQKIAFIQSTAKALYKKFLDYTKHLRMKP